MRIGYDDADSLLTYPHVNNLSAHGQPIRIHGREHDLQRTMAPHPVLLLCDAMNHAAHAWSRTHAPTHPRTHHTVHTPYVTRASHGRIWSDHPRIHNGHTKRARTNRSGRATYSAQALGRLPWFAPFLRRSRRLRPRFDMSFSLGLLSRLKHFCTHWPKPPRHRPFAATKVTEKRAAAPASSVRVTPRGRALSQRVQRQVTDTLVIEATTRARSASEACSVS